MPIGLVTTMAAVMRSECRLRLRPPVPDASPPGQIPGLAAAAVTR
jgi:hypothetical protein